MTNPDLLQAGWRESSRTVNGIRLHVVEAGSDDTPLLLRGYVASDAPPDVSAYVLDTLVADVLALADTFDAGRFHLVGHDWGAVIAWGLAATHPERLERVAVMDGPHPDVRARQALKHPTQALRNTYVAFFQLPWWRKRRSVRSTTPVCGRWWRAAPSPARSSPGRSTATSRHRPTRAG